MPRTYTKKPGVVYGRPKVDRPDAPAKPKGRPVGSKNLTPESADICTPAEIAAICAGKTN